jgi:hypothetical protein
MTPRPKSLFGKGGASRNPSAMVLVCTVVLVVDMLLLSTLPSHNRPTDARHVQPGDRLRGWEATAPAAAVRTSLDTAMGLSPDRETLTLYYDMVRFWGLNIEIGKVGQVSFAEDFPFTAAPAGLVQNIAVFSPEKNMSALSP